MPEFPIQIRYTLSRWQRLGPHLRMWGIGTTLFVLTVWLFFVVRFGASALELDYLGIAVFGGLAFGGMLLFRGLFVGIIDALVVPVRMVDLEIEENAIGVLLGSERWYLFLDGVQNLQQ